MTGWLRATVWQIAGGSMARNYADDFVEHDVVGIGGAQVESAVQMFKKMQDGDLVVLRDDGSRTRVRAIGMIAGPFPSEAGPYFRGQGWALEHLRRVRWLVEEPYQFDGGKLDRRRVSKVVTGRSAIIARVETAEFDVDRPLRELPPPVRPVELNEAALPEPVQTLRLLANRFQSLSFYDNKRFGPLPRENEATSHFVVPLLVGLGWPYHLIAVEWHRIDVAVFARLPRTAASCHFIIEVKHVGTGPTGAEAQLARYKRSLKLSPNTETYASDGFCFWAFQDGGRTLMLDLIHPTVEGLQVLERLRPPAEIARA